MTNPLAIERILARLGLPTELCVIAPPRGPPEQELLFHGPRSVFEDAHD